MNRSFTALLSTRSRLHAVTAAAALAFIAGLSAPAAAATSPDAVDSSSPAQASVVSTQGGIEKVANVATSDADPAKAKADKAAAKPAAKKAAPSAKQLHPKGVGGSQESLKPDAEQLKNARAIVHAGQKMGLPPRAYVIAVATALQESALHNLGDLGASNDHDSLGLFQQRPSSGWGTPEQVRDPEYAATSFYKGLTGVGGWDKMELTDAAQAVQVSAFPDHYAKWESEAGKLVQAAYGEGPYADKK